jgi:hypothetical protein
VGAIRLVLTSMASAMASGLAVVTATVIGVDLLRPATPTPEPQLGAPLYLLFFGTMAGLLLAGIVAWWLLAPILSIYRRGGLSVVSGLATFVLAVLICIPVHQLSGRSGLIVLGGLALVTSLVFARSARRTVAA